jgi:hypothetical protein
LDTASLLGRPSTATNFIKNFCIGINDLVLLYRIVTVAAALPHAAGSVVEFRVKARAGRADV